MTVNKLYIYQFVLTDQSTKFFEIDHETRCVYVEEIKKINPKIQIPLSKKKIYKKLSKPIVSFDIGPKDISFERYLRLYYKKL